MKMLLLFILTLALSPVNSFARDTCSIPFIHFQCNDDLSTSMISFEPVDEKSTTMNMQVRNHIVELDPTGPSFTGIPSVCNCLGDSQNGDFSKGGFDKTEREKIQKALVSKYYENNMAKIVRSSQIVLKAMMMSDEKAAYVDNANIDFCIPGAYLKATDYIRKNGCSAESQQEIDQVIVDQTNSMLTSQNVKHDLQMAHEVFNTLGIPVHEQTQTAQLAGLFKSLMFDSELPTLGGTAIDSFLNIFRSEEAVRQSKSYVMKRFYELAKEGGGDIDTKRLLSEIRENKAAPLNYTDQEYSQISEIISQYNTCGKENCSESDLKKIGRNEIFQKIYYNTSLQGVPDAGKNVDVISRMAKTADFSDEKLVGNFLQDFTKRLQDESGIIKVVDINDLKKQMNNIQDESLDEAILNCRQAAESFARMCTAMSDENRLISAYSSDNEDSFNILNYDFLKEVFGDNIPSDILSQKLARLQCESAFDDNFRQKQSYSEYVTNLSNHIRNYKGYVPTSPATRDGWSSPEEAARMSLGRGFIDTSGGYKQAIRQGTGAAFIENQIAQNQAGVITEPVDNVNSFGGDAGKYLQGQTYVNTGVYGQGNTTRINSPFREPQNIDQFIADNEKDSLSNKELQELRDQLDIEKGKLKSLQDLKNAGTQLTPKQDQDYLALMAKVKDLERKLADSQQTRLAASMAKKQNLLDIKAAQDNSSGTSRIGSSRTTASTTFGDNGGGDSVGETQGGGAQGFFNGAGTTGGGTSGGSTGGAGFDSYGSGSYQSDLSNGIALTRQPASVDLSRQESLDIGSIFLIKLGEDIIDSLAKAPASEKAGKVIVSEAEDGKYRQYFFDDSGQPYYVDMDGDGKEELFYLERVLDPKTGKFILTLDSQNLLSEVINKEASRQRDSVNVDIKEYKDIQNAVRRLREDR